MLIKLKDLEKEGKDRKEHLVKEIEKGIQKKLEVSPDTWISKDKSLSELTAPPLTTVLVLGAIAGGFAVSLWRWKGCYGY